MDFTQMFWILLGVLGILGTLAFVFLFKSTSPMSKLPLGDSLFPKQNPNEYISKRGVVMDTPNGKVRVRGVRISEADPNFARLLVCNEFGEEYLIDSHISNIAYEQNIQDVWQVMCHPEQALRWACNLDKTNMPRVNVGAIGSNGHSSKTPMGDLQSEITRGFDGKQQQEPFSRLQILHWENEMLRQRAEDALRMAADVASSGAEERKIIHQAEVSGIKKESEYGDKSRPEVLPQRMPVNVENDEDENN